MKAHNRKLVTYLVLILVAIAVIGIAAKSTQTNQSGGRAALFLTQPIYSVSGMVEKVNGDTITLAVTSQTPLPPNSNPTTKLNSPPKPETMMFTVKTNGQTKYNRPGSSAVPYLFGNSHPQPAQTGVKSVTVGQLVTVESKTDLRTLSTPGFTASVINLPALSNVLSGAVTSIQNDLLILNTVYGEKKVSLTPATEISGNVAEDASKPALPKKYSLNDIKVNSQVTVYTDKDATGNEVLTALRIDPGMAVGNRQVISGGQPSAQPASQTLPAMEQSSSVPAANPTTDTSKPIPTLTMPTIDPQNYVQQ